jgi:AraC-like DNA-binding protein
VRRLQCGRRYCSDVQRKHFAQRATEFASGEQACDAVRLEHPGALPHAGAERRAVDEIRFETACQLLDNTQLPLTDIAASLGYSQSSAFMRAFRCWCGVVPSRRRRTESRGSLIVSADFESHVGLYGAGDQ